MVNGAGVPQTAPSTRYGWYVVFVLVLAYTISYVDRTILTLMVDPIRLTLRISDVQISLLHGLAFAIFYTVLGLPIGRLVDRYRRTTIITGGIIVWSIMTGLCGAAGSFGQMFAARIGVGVGEATLSPAAYSLLSDLFPPALRARALSIYSGAIYMGAGLALIAGGALIASIHPVTLPLFGHLETWQLVFVIIAIPGFFVAILTALLREPARCGLMVPVRGTATSLSALYRYLYERRAAYTLMIVGFSVSATMWTGISAWIPSLFIRSFGWTTAQTGLAFGSALLVFGTSGIVFGSVLAGSMRRHGRRDANLRLGVVSTLSALPLGVAASLITDGSLAFVFVCAFVFAASLPYGGAAAAIQDITPNQMRGQVSALYLFLLNLAGIGLGPTLVATLKEHVFTGPLSLHRAMAAVIVMTLPVSALLLAKACRPYRLALDQASFDEAPLPMPPLVRQAG